MSETRRAPTFDLHEMEFNSAAWLTDLMPIPENGGPSEPIEVYRREIDHRNIRPGADDPELVLFRWLAPHGVKNCPRSMAVAQYMPVADEDEDGVWREWGDASWAIPPLPVLSVPLASLGNPNIICVFKWDHAPQALKDLSRHGGDEDWVAFLPANLSGEDIPWIRRGGFGSCSVDTIWFEDGSRVCIGAHA